MEASVCVRETDIHVLCTITWISQCAHVKNQGRAAVEEGNNPASARESIRHTPPPEIAGRPHDHTHPDKPHQVAVRRLPSGWRVGEVLKYCCPHKTHPRQDLKFKHKLCAVENDKASYIYICIHQTHILHRDTSELVKWETRKKSQKKGTGKNNNNHLNSHHHRYHMCWDNYAWYTSDIGVPPPSRPLHIG